MIKIDVFIQNKNWKKYISNPSKYLGSKVRYINSSFSFFKNKKINFSILLAGNKEVRALNKKFRKKNSKLNSVKISELEAHKIKMVIYANQTLRVAHMAMSRLLKEMINADHISDIEDKMSTMQDIFSLQEMYDIKNKEKKLEEELKKLGYIN